MSLSIEVSFERDDELLAVTERLRDLPLKVSRHYQKPGVSARVPARRGPDGPGGGDRASTRRRQGRGPSRPRKPISAPLQRPRDANQSRIKSGAKLVQSRYRIVRKTSAKVPQN